MNKSDLHLALQRTIHLTLENTKFKIHMTKFGMQIQNLLLLSSTRLAVDFRVSECYPRDGTKWLPIRAPPVQTTDDELPDLPNLSGARMKANIKTNTIRQTNKRTSRRRGTTGTISSELCLGNQGYHTCLIGWLDIQYGANHPTAEYWGTVAYPTF